MHQESSRYNSQASSGDLIIRPNSQASSSDLINMGRTHCFIDPHIVKKTQILVKKAQVLVKATNGDLLPFQSRCTNVPIFFVGP